MAKAHSAEGIGGTIPDRRVPRRAEAGVVEVTVRPRSLEFHSRLRGYEAFRKVYPLNERKLP